MNRKEFLSREEYRELRAEHDNLVQKAKAIVYFFNNNVDALTAVESNKMCKEYNQIVDRINEIERIY